MSRKDDQIPLFPDLSSVPPQLRESSRKLIEGTEGLGIKNKQAPVSVMLPPDMDREIRSMKNRSRFIREAISQKLYGTEGVEGIDYDEAISRYLLTLPPPKRREAKRLLKGFVESLSE